MKTAKFKFLTVFVLTIVLLTLVFVAGQPVFNKAYADTEITETVQDYEWAESEEDGIAPRLFTSLSISLDCGNGKVWATVKNSFTLFPSTVIVVVMLYSSVTYTESYTNMTLVSSKSTSDLDMGNTITTEASTGGVEKYWIARMRYKIDSGSWESKETGVCKVGANGDFLGYC